MDIEVWLDAAVTDARRRGLPDVEPLLEALARATRQLRAARFDDLPADELANRDRSSERAAD
jgi:hypothetical protein